ncbi:MAG TPA: hypothetical protein VKO20_01085, partial [Desulfosalsimonadaceae bacterium]|nr:hypothetical protein [Desulfosalsimonadaceae bacterium]
FQDLRQGASFTSLTVEVQRGNEKAGSGGECKNRCRAGTKDSGRSYQSLIILRTSPVIAKG